MKSAQKTQITKNKSNREHVSLTEKALTDADAESFILVSD